MGVLEAFGEDFLQKYQDTLKKNRIQKLELNDQTKSEIIELVKNNLRPESPALIYPKGRFTYDIALVETMATIDVKTLKFGLSIGTRWSGNWLGCIIDENLIRQLSPNTFYVFVGKMSLKQGIGRTFYNMNVHGIITMEEIEAGGYPKSKEVNVPQFK
jgi:hypothetical protein